MTAISTLAALWLGLALIASLLSIWLRIATALSEIVVGTVAQLVIGAALGSAVLGTDESCKIDAFLPVLDRMMTSGLVTIETIRVLQYGTEMVHA